MALGYPEILSDRSETEEEEEEDEEEEDYDEHDGVEYLRRKLKHMISGQYTWEEEAMTVPGMHFQRELQLKSRYMLLAFQSIAVVFGDMGTAPLYVYSNTFPAGFKDTSEDVVGALSIILYTILLFPLCKYLMIVLRANDNGEGGTFALYSLICRYAKINLLTTPHPTDHELSTYKLPLPSKELERGLWLKEKLEGSAALKSIVLLLTLIGTCMIVANGTLTPAISVLAAASGLKVRVDAIDEDIVVVIAIIVLIFLFLLQRHGTSKVGFLFAPVASVWFVSIGLLGAYNVYLYDCTVFRALNPLYIYYYFKKNGKDGWVSLSGIVLCIKGTEATFADLGHFSVKSIRIAFGALVLPSLVLAYAGQASYLLKHPEDISDVFYKSIPDSIFWPMFIVTAMSAIVASQAMLSASFSVIKMAESLGCFPRVNIVHTSRRFPGRIYIPEVNWFIMIATVGLTALFRNSTELGSAYGIAVVTTMFVTTCLLTFIMLMIWQINMVLALGFFFLFGSVELVYLSSVFYKIKDGGWVSLAFAACMLTCMYIWHYGTKMKYEYEVRHKLSMDWLTKVGPDLRTVRVPGLVLVYNGLVHGIPGIFEHFVNHFPAIHSILVFVSIRYLPVATVPQVERVLVRRVGPKEYRMYRCIARYGYRDMRAETTRTFEQLLIQSLENFLYEEARNEALETVDMSDGNTLESLLTPLLDDGFDRDLDEEKWIEKSYSKASYPAGFTVADEIALLQKYASAGIVYLLGRGDVRATKDSFFLKKLVINYLYAFLRRNCKQRTETLHIPHSRLLHVGMTYFV